MGKPFETEIQSIPSTVHSVCDVPLDSSLTALVDRISSYPLLVVGSGGSLTSANFAARLHEETTGRLAKAVTPLDLMLSPLRPDKHAALFITARGNNEDILNSFQWAVKKEFAAVAIVCANTSGKLVERAEHYHNGIHSFAFDTPSGRDGFVAVNSLLATCIWMARGYGRLDVSNTVVESLLNAKHLDENEVKRVLERRTIVALGGQWSWPAVLDLESKFAEVGLGNIFISDLRNFGHGRHNWFNKRGKETALIILDTPSLRALTKKTLSYMPTEYPSMVMSSQFDGPLAGIDLLIKVFNLVLEAGKRVAIDPGRPGVPVFGTKMYHIAFNPSATSKKAKGNRHIWLERKCRALDQSPCRVDRYLNDFLSQFEAIQFSGIVFDYDGTLCDPVDRYSRPRKEIGNCLNELLSSGIKVGIATGRGQSVQESLRQVINEKNWNNLLVGNYNGSFVLTLDQQLPESRKTLSNLTRRVCDILQADTLISRLASIDASSKQISVVPNNKSNEVIRTRIMEILSGMPGIKIVESDHSIDILHMEVSKLSVLSSMRAVGGESMNVMVIGDQGQYGGNDFELLSVPHSLSVDRISTSLHTCWNLSPMGLRGVSATLSIIGALVVENQYVKLDAECLEKVGS